MFGPNTIYTPVTPKIYCHRSLQAYQLADEVREKFKQLFKLENYDILLIPGPATVAMQTVLESLNHVLGVDVIGNGKFDRRWRSIAPSPEHTTPGNTGLCYCLLETSQSRLTTIEYWHRPSFLIVDAVSGFPYYQIPKQADVFVTTSCKQLGAPPGIAIVGIKQDAWGFMQKTGTERYTDIFNHRGKHFMTTAPINVLEVLVENLTAERVAKVNGQIDSVCELLTPLLPDLIGEKRCPVLTFPRESFNKKYRRIARDFALYPEITEGAKNYQIFTYSHPMSDYLNFINCLKTCSLTS